MRIFVTGVTGFLGTHLAQTCVERGWQVHGTSAGGRWRAGVPRHVCDSVPVIPWDIRHPADDRMRDWLQAFSPDAVVHLAGVSVPADCGVPDPTPLALETNVQGTRHVVDAVIDAGLRPRFVLASSCHVYRHDMRRPAVVSEGHELAPANGYGITKLAAEAIVQDRCGNAGMPWVVLRGFQSTGPQQSERMLLPEWTSQVVQGADPVRVRCLRTALDLMDVRDTVAFQADFCRPDTPTGIFNLGSGHVTRGAGIMRALRAAAGRRFRIESGCRDSRWNPIADVARLHAALPRRPVHPLDETVRETLRHWQARAERDRPRDPPRR